MIIKVILLLLLLLIESACSFIFSPPVVELKVRPGETTQFKLTVINDSDDELICKLYLTDISKTEEGNLLFPDAGTTIYSCAKYIKIGKETVELGPKQMQEITCELDLHDASVQAGGRYAVVMCEPMPKGMPEELRRAQPRWRLGCIIKLIIEGIIRKRIFIKDIVFNPATEEAARNVEFIIENKSNIHISKGEGHLLIMDAKNREIKERLDLDLKPTIFPQTSLKFKAVPKRYLPIGEYIAKVTVDYQGIKATSKEIKFHITQEEKRLHEEKVVASRGHLLAISAEPANLTVKLCPGSFRTHPIKLKNEEDMELKVKVRVVDVISTESGELEFVELGKTGYSLKNILDIQPKEFVILPKSTKMLMATIRLPKEYKTDSRLYGSVLFDLQSIGKDFKLQDTLSLDTCLIPEGVLIKEACGTITNVAIKYPKAKDWLSFEVEFKNTGGIALAPNLFILVKDKFYRDMAKLESKLNYLLPGYTGKFIVTSDKFEKRLESGKYFADIRINYNKEKTATLRKEFEIK